MRRLLTVLGLLGLFLVSGASAMADDIQLSCPACVGGGTSLIAPDSGGSLSFSFVSVANQTYTGNAFIAILVPNGGAAPTLTGGTLVQTLSFTSGSLGSLLGQNLTSYNLSNFQSAGAQVGVNPAGYTVYEFSVGGNVTLGPSGAGITGLVANGLTEGSVIVGLLQTANGTYQTPLSESITVTEPGSLTLLGAGLLALGVLSRRRFARD